MGSVRRFTVRSSVVLAVAVVFCFTLVAAQEGAIKPGPEHERLGFFVGNWTGEGKVNESPMMPAGPMTGKSRCEWFDGKFAVVCHEESSGPMGKTKGIGIMSYSADAGAYTYYGTDSSGMMTMTTVPMGKVDGKTWVYNDESEMGGSVMKSRFTIVETSATSYTYKFEMEGQDGKWMTIMEGSAKKS